MARGSDPYMVPMQPLPMQPRALFPKLYDWVTYSEPITTADANPIPAGTPGQLVDIYTVNDIVTANENGNDCKIDFRADVGSDDETDYRDYRVEAKLALCAKTTAPQPEGTGAELAKVDFFWLYRR